MKDSGIEWLGEVPAHWSIKRLSWICTDINDINHEMPKAVEDGVLFLSAKDLLDDGTLNFTDDVKMISEDDYERLSQKIRPQFGDIIYSRIGAALGKARLVETNLRFNISYSCCVVRVMEELACREYVRFVLDGEMILTEARMRTKGIGVPDLGLKEIGRFPIPLPPISEQRKIVEFLLRETTRFNNLLMEAERSVSLLQERRSALISAAVTGQIDVRGLAPKEAA
jgi:type I restriction enzyme S subunit